MKEKALAEANIAANKLVKMAKIGGMSDEDVQQCMEFPAGPDTTASLSDDSLMSLAALAKSGGLWGDEAGTFIRSASSKLASPNGKTQLMLSGHLQRSVRGRAVVEAFL